MVRGRFDRPVWLCGGAGWVMSRPALEDAVAGLHKCRSVPELNAASAYDLRLGRCMIEKVGLVLEERPEFHSQPPPYYATPQAAEPADAQGFSRPVTFHYMTHDRNPLVPSKRPYSWSEIYASLYLLTRPSVKEANESYAAWRRHVRSEAITNRSVAGARKERRLPSHSTPLGFASALHQRRGGHLGAAGHASQSHAIKRPVDARGKLPG